MTEAPLPFTRRRLAAGGERITFLAPGGWPIAVECDLERPLARLGAAARAVGADWLHGLALVRRAEGGLALVGVAGPRVAQLLHLREGAEGVDAGTVRTAASALLTATEAATDDALRTASAAFEAELARAGAALPPRRRPADGDRRAWRARARALLEGLEAVGEQGATEWIPTLPTAFRADPAHLWLRPELGFTAPEPERAFCTTHPTPAELGVLALPDEWSTRVRVGGRRHRLRLGLWSHPRGASLALLEPDHPDLAVVVATGEHLQWWLYDRDDYCAAYLDRRRPAPKDARRF